MHMRMHIEIDAAILAEIDSMEGPRRRSAFVRKAIVEAVDRRRRAKCLREAAGVLRDSTHEWDPDPADWVRRQRYGDPERVG